MVPTTQDSPFGRVSERASRLDEETAREILADGRRYRVAAAVAEADGTLSEEQLVTMLAAAEYGRPPDRLDSHHRQSVRGALDRDCLSVLSAHDAVVRTDDGHLRPGRSLGRLLALGEKQRAEASDEEPHAPGAR